LWLLFHNDMSNRGPFVVALDVVIRYCCNDDDPVNNNEAVVTDINAMIRSDQAFHRYLMATSCEPVRVSVLRAVEESVPVR
jgi:hypothetical protein